MYRQSEIASAARPRVLVVLAHPDDESFGMGGTLALYAWCGADVYLVCATGGEEGEMAPELLEGYGSIADRRAAELDCAARALGLAGVTMMGYRDSGMPGAEANRHPQALFAQTLDSVAARVTAEIRRVRPHVVLTFDPIGGYRHPDHIAIQRATVEAFHAAGDPARYPGDLSAYAPQKLYFHTFPRGLLRLVVRLMPLFGRDPRRFGTNGDIDVASLAEVEYPIHAKIDFLPMARAREEAGACHVSQGGASGGLRSVVGRLLLLLGGRDTFMRAFPEPTPGLRERDLFEGVTIDP
ncbi:PIG-L family deacetylase [Oscillochloris sp. ZM17-4]|uniref:PIG-L family deacetylase n=1 Tax=Oscillochloris sp. ZM17-4 TaxID=2866714 RepID=UPI001C733E1B|nr:PIG-L family deacetylase [Oscillochloris sp. ZM17-4]MBX0330111.1 PIG-L family deacetylase [Oscillochloris sp. ZM17-4]